MSYSSYETSIASGEPIELYKFVEGSNISLFSTYHDDIEFNGELYIPSSLKRDRIKQTTDSFKNDISIKFPRNNEFALSFITSTPEDITTLTIFRGHVGDITSDGIDFQSYWKGRVLGADVTGNEINMVCESVFTSMRRVGVRARYEYSCRHALYSTGCGLNKVSFANAGLITAISTNRITLTISELALQSDGYYSGGFIVVEGIRRFIINHVGNTIDLMSNIPENIIVGHNVTFYAGCDHSKETCNSKFSNIINFGGFPYIPSSNPFGLNPF